MGAVREGACVFMASGERHVAARLVLAAGAWATQVAGLPRPLPVRPVRGELLTLEADPPPCVVYGGGGYLIPRGGAVLVGATSEDDGFVVRTSASGRESLLGVADRAAGLGGAHVASHWAGLRPMTPDNLPILGADPDHPWLVHAGGFSRNGILFAPWAARQVAVELGGASVAALDPFRAGRFQARPPRGPLNG
jgi:glycine oxidase